VANQSGAYYDVFALIHKLWFPNEAFKQQASFEYNGVSK